MSFVLCKNLFGQEVYVSAKSAAAFRRHGGFDAPTLRLIADLAANIPGAVACDVGANVGNHTVVLGKFCAQVIGFEPRLLIEEVLRENVAHNKLTNCELVPAGLSDIAGTATLYVDRQAEGGTSTFVKALVADAA